MLAVIIVHVNFADISGFRDGALPVGSLTNFGQHSKT